MGPVKLTYTFRQFRGQLVNLKLCLMGVNSTKANVMVNSGQGNQHSAKDLTEQETALLKRFLAFSTHPKASPEKIEGQLLASLALALDRRELRC